MDDDNKCIVCQETIKPNASRCPHCSSFQSYWKNTLLYYGGVIGLVIFIISLFNYLWSKSIDLLTQNQPLRISSYFYNQGAIFYNRDDSEIYVEDILVEVPKYLQPNKEKLPNSQEIEIKPEPLEGYFNTIVKPHEFVTYHPENQKTIGGTRIFYPQDDSPVSLKKEDWSSAWEDKNKCFRIYLSLEKDINAEKTTALIDYVSIHGDKTEKIDLYVGLQVKKLTDKDNLEYCHIKHSDIFKKDLRTGEINSPDDQIIWSVPKQK